MAALFWVRARVDKALLGEVLSLVVLIDVDSTIMGVRCSSRLPIITQGSAYVG